MGISGFYEADVKQTAHTLPIIRVGVLYPSHGRISDETEEGLRSLSVLTKEYKFDPMIEKCTDIARGRNKIINHWSSDEIDQRVEGFDYVLFIDSDIGFNEEDVVKLIKDDKDIVSGAYQARDWPNYYCAGMFSEGGAVKFGTDKFIPNKKRGLIEVDWVGAGFLLIKRGVFDKIKFPWFNQEYIYYTQGGKSVAIWNGEDVHFCRLAKKAGIPVYLDCDCVVEHLIDFSPEDEGGEIEQSIDEVMNDLSEEMYALQSEMKLAKRLQQKIKSRVKSHQLLQKEVQHGRYNSTAGYSYHGDHSGSH